MTIGKNCTVLFLIIVFIVDYQQYTILLQASIWNGLGFLENCISVAEMSGMLFSKIKIIELLTIETFRPSCLSMVV